MNKFFILLLLAANLWAETEKVSTPVSVKPKCGVQFSVGIASPFIDSHVYNLPYLGFNLDIWPSSLGLEIGAYLMYIVNPVLEGKLLVAIPKIKNAYTACGCRGIFLVGNDPSFGLLVGIGFLKSRFSMELNLSYTRCYFSTGGKIGVFL